MSEKLFYVLFILGISMINWNETELKFGYKSSNDLIGKRPKIIVICDKCPRSKIIAVRIKSRIINNQLSWLCQSCATKNASSIISSNMKNQWNNQEYRNNITNKSLYMWDNQEYRNKHQVAVIEAMKNVDMTLYTDKYKTLEYRIKHKNISIALWNDPQFRKHHLTSMQSPEISIKCSEGAKKAWQNPEYRKSMAIVRASQCTKITKIQIMLYQLLDDLKIDYIKEGPNTRVGHYVFDCKIPSYNVLIECQGDYWHSDKNPENVRNDKAKFTYISKYFPQYKIFYIWEREFYQKDRVLNRLKNLLDIEQNCIDFDFKNVEIRKITSSHDFLLLYHYIGPSRGGINYGAFLKDELIGIAVFSPPLRQNTANQFNLTNNQIKECSRFCIHPNYQKRNFASWFLTKCSKQFKNILLYSYADQTVGHTGAMYKAAGWILHHVVAPDYWYCDNDGYVMHKRTLYGRAISLRMTEAEFASKYNYNKVFGGPKLCFVKQVY